MKISVVTVYNSHNYGSFLQARQLGKTLSSYGEVTFYDSHSRKMTRSFLRKSKKIIQNRQSVMDLFRGPAFEWVELQNLKRCWKSLPSGENQDADVAVLGSDEIWNITRKVCRFPVYWGAGFRAFKIAYAPSVNNTETADLEQYPEYIDYLKKIDCISVRDRHSKKVVESFLQQKEESNSATEEMGSKVPIVLDPTMLEDPEMVPRKIRQPYIGVYLFYGALTKEQIQAIRNFAKEKNLLLVSAGQYISWCDRCVHTENGNPFTIFKDAEYVVTNTFHGTAYAINYRTQFVSFAKGKTKVEEMAGSLGLAERIVSEPEEFARKLETPIDYTSVSVQLAQARKQSADFLRDAFRGMEKREAETGR